MTNQSNEDLLEEWWEKEPFGFDDREVLLLMDKARAIGFIEGAKYFEDEVMKRLNMAQGDKNDQSN